MHSAEHGGIMSESPAMAAHTAPRQMNTLAARLEELATALGTADRVVTAFQSLRDACSDDEWGALCDSGPLSDLLDACSDLEYDLKR